MFKKALKSAIGPSIGIVIGRVFFRITNLELYDKTWPNIFVQAALYLFVGYIVCFTTSLIIELIKTKIKNSEFTSNNR